jgi:hypothetical protein
MPEEAEPVKLEEYWQKLKALGCGREIGTSRLWAVDLPPFVDLSAVYDLLEAGEADHIWELEEAHVGHAVR